MNNIEKSSEFGFEFYSKKLSFDSLIKYLFKRQYCIGNKLALLILFYFSISFGFSFSFILLTFLFLNPLYSMFVHSNGKKEEIFLNNSTYYDVFTKINNGIDYQSEIDKLTYLNIPNFIALTIIFIIIMVPHFYDKLKSIYFLLILLLFNTAILTINIFISIIYNRIRNSIKKYPNELDIMFASNGTHIIPLDKRDNLNPYGGDSIFLCIIYYVIIIMMFIVKRIHEKKKSRNDDENNNEYNEKLNSAN